MDFIGYFQYYLPTFVEVRATHQLFSSDVRLRPSDDYLMRLLEEGVFS